MVRHPMFQKQRLNNNVSRTSQKKDKGMSLKFKSIAVVGALLGSLALAGCGQEEKDPNHIKVGVIVGAEQQVAEVAQKVAKDKYGLDVELVTFNDYVLPNEALSKGDIDANAFQHKPYLDSFNKEKGTNLVSVGPDVFGQFDAFGGKCIHLPVAGNDFLSHIFVFKID